MNSNNNIITTQENTNQIDALLSQAEQYFEQQDYQQAIQYYLKAAWLGSKTAMLWYLDAANHHHSEAMFMIGTFYDEGYGVEKNYEQAMQWYLKSASYEDADAMYNIALLYQNGQGVEQDYGQAMQWYLKAASHNHVAAMSNISGRTRCRTKLSQSNRLEYQSC